MPQSKLTEQRNHTIDTIKLIASFFVICIHTKTTSAVDLFEQGSFSFVIDNIARFAVPFFFAAGGYFINFGNSGKLLKRLLTVAIIYAQWSFIFIWIRSANELEYPSFLFSGNRETNGIMNTIYKMIFYGYERHLWFFPAYIIAALLIAGTRKHLWLLTLLAASCYAAGLTGQQFKIIYPSQVSFLPEPTYDWLQRTYFTRSGMFFAFPCMTVGYLVKQFSHHLERVSLPIFTAAIIGLFSLQYFECVTMMNRHNIPASDYYATTIFLVAAILVVAAKSKREKPLIRNAGKLAGGVYVMHPLFMYFFFINYKELFNHELWPYLFTPMLFILSLVSTMIVSKIPVVRKMIMA